MEIRNTKESLAAEDADLSGSGFRDLDLSGSTFVDINLFQTSFENINLAGAKLRDVNFNGVEIRDCDLSGMTIDGIPVQEALDAYERNKPATAAGAAGANDVAPYKTCVTQESQESQEPQESRNEASEIRPFRASDEPEVVALWKSVFAYPAPHNDPITVIRLKRKVDPGLFLIATQGPVIAGTIMGGYDGHRGWIYSLAVRPDLRRRGTGAALIRSVERALAARGCLKVNLQLLASNAETTAFHKKLGYAVEERVSMGRLL